MKSFKLSHKTLRKIVREEISKVKNLNESFPGEYDEGPGYFDSEDDTYGRVWDKLSEFADDPRVDTADIVGDDVVLYFADGHYETIMSLTPTDDLGQVEAAIEDWNDSSPDEY